VLYAAFARGLSFKVTQGSVLAPSPLLIIGRSDLDRALNIVTEALDEAAATDTGPGSG